MIPLRIFFVALLASCSRPAYEQRGYASYIADRHAGQHTSAGEIYHPQGWTAAHNTLPFGTQIKVKNNYNGRSVNLIVNDRFPHYPGRVINLSRAAAVYLHLPPYQLVDVTVTAKTIPGYGAVNPARGAVNPARTTPPLSGYNAIPSPRSPGRTNYLSAPLPADSSQHIRGMPLRRDF